MRRDRAERRAARGGDADLLRLDREIAARGGARWAFAVAMVDDRFSGRRPTVDRSPPSSAWSRATITYSPWPSRRADADVRRFALGGGDVSFDVWLAPVSTISGLAALNDELLAREVKGRQTFLLDMQSMEIVDLGKEPRRFRLRGDGEPGPLWAGFEDSSKRHFRVMCVFCRGPVGEEASWRRRHVTKDEPGEGEVAETCDMIGCKWRVWV